VLYAQSFAQGDPYAPLGFALTAQGMYAAVKDKSEERRREKAETFNAYLDDLVTVGSWQLMLDQFETYVKVAKKFGIKVQPSKCCLFWQSDQAIPDDCSRRAAALGIQVEHRLMVVGGVPICKKRDSPALTTWLGKLKQQHHEFFNVLQKADLGEWEGGVPAAARVWCAEALACAPQSTTECHGRHGGVVRFQGDGSDG